MVLTAEQIKSQKNIKIEYPIGTTIRFLNKNDTYFWAITGIKLFPTQYEISVYNGNSISNKLTLSLPDLNSFKKDIRQITIPPIYFPEENFKGVFYFISPEYIKEIQRRLDYCNSYSESKYLKTPKNTPKIYTLKIISDYDYYKSVSDIISQFENGTIVSSFDNYEQIILGEIKKIERAKLSRARLKAIIEQTNINLNLLANETKLQVNFLNCLLSGSRNLGEKSARKLSMYFNISYEYLVGKTDDSSPVIFSQTKNQKSKALNSTGQVQNLTTKEMQLLEKFKLLSSPNQSQLLGYMDFLISQETLKNKIS